MRAQLELSPGQEWRLGSDSLKSSVLKKAMQEFKGIAQLREGNESHWGCPNVTWMGFGMHLEMILLDSGNAPLPDCRQGKSEPY